jgi:peptidoglycan-associated lipoprotein
MPTVRFRSGQVSFGKTDVAALDNVARWLKDNPGAGVVIEGHTDDLGTPSENIAVGEKRAASIMRYLVAKGIDPTRITIVSYGSDHPVCWEKTETCRAKNRRADVVVKRP